MSSALRQISVAFNHGAMSYAMLYEMALRLYEPPLREIAPEHLKAYADAALTINRSCPPLWPGSWPRTLFIARASAPCVGSVPVRVLRGERRP